MNNITSVAGSNGNAWLAVQDMRLPVNDDVRIDGGMQHDMEGSVLEDISCDDIDKAIDDMNRSLNMLNTKLKFVVHEETGKLMVQVVDRETGKVIKEIPPHIFLDIEARIERFLGILFDKRI